MKTIGGISPAGHRVICGLDEAPGPDWNPLRNDRDGRRAVRAVVGDKAPIRLLDEAFEALAQGRCWEQA